MLQSLNVKDAPPRPEEWDGDWKCIDYDPVEQISEWQLFEETVDGKQFVHRRVIQHNVNQMLDANQREFNAQLGARWGNGKKVATVPTPVWSKLGLDDAFANGDWTKIKRTLNNSDYSRFRTFKGNL